MTTKSSGNRGQCIISKQQGICIHARVHSSKFNNSYSTVFPTCTPALAGPIFTFDTGIGVGIGNSKLKFSTASFFVITVIVIVFIWIKCKKKPNQETQPILNGDHNRAGDREN